MAKLAKRIYEGLWPQGRRLPILPTPSGATLQARIRKLISDLGEVFWLVPAAMVVAGILLAVGLVGVDKSGLVPAWLIDSPWLYHGGGTGARTLLGAVASSTIGVAGTVFSITIAALSLAAGQMGPRLLRNFTRAAATSSPSAPSSVPSPTH